ncbi:MAG: glycosyltransferase family 2 protein [Verrucomicrobiota bacterium JB023]|nr:glycosyltransferase family 2 protein [Verrucomicrobiota bacterium JB023]
MKVKIVIPTYNRAHCLPQALDSALSQTYHGTEVTVVDDGSTDNTRQVIERYLDDPRLTYIRLKTNGGTAAAKNMGLVFGDYDAVTFHDSDDVASPNKVLLQTRALALKGHADDILDWQMLGHEPGSELNVDVAVGAHKFIKLDGSVHIIDKRISLVDDFFPTLQSPSKTEGDWVLINSGLFRRRCFSRLGGYLDSVEEDRELRNRLIACGHIFHFIAEPLLTKVEMAVSLTTNDDTGYRGEKRKQDRDEVWRRNRLYRNGKWGNDAVEESKVPIDLNGVQIAEIISHQPLTIGHDLPLAEGTRKFLSREVIRNTHSLGGQRTRGRDSIVEELLPQAV